MLKTISAALLAVSVLAAPALAATSAKTAQAPVIKAEQTKQLMKPTVRNANANMGRHHRHYSHYNHHRSLKHVGALNSKGHKFSKVTIKHTGPASRHG